MYLTTEITKTVQQYKGRKMENIQVFINVQYLFLKKIPNL